VLVLGERLAPLAIVGGLPLLAGIALTVLLPLGRRATPAPLAETPS
jgi:drug/metabolite transporter (DMT)-like permease